MKSGGWCAAYHEDLSAELKSCCDECPFPRTSRACKKNKSDCCFHNFTVAEYVLKTYGENVLKKIQLDSLVRGIRAYGFTGKIQQTTVVKL